MKNLLGLIAGLLFGAGLYLAMMVNPEKVLAFLDVAGAWDPSLALVMASAIGVSAIGFALSRKMNASWSGADFAWPTTSGVDARLTGGACLFGLGWGMTGYCPGPGLSAMVVNPHEAIPFVTAMLLGMIVWEWCDRKPTATD